MALTNATRVLNLDIAETELEDQIEIIPQPGPSKSKENDPTEDKIRDPDQEDDFQPEKPSTSSAFKKPAVPIPIKSRAKTKARAIPKKAKKQPDIRKVLGINPELDYKDEEMFQKMILQRGREENMNADDLQIALAMSKSMSEQSGGGSADVEGPSRSKARKKRAVEFFEMLGMNQKKQLKEKRTRTKATKISLLSIRDADKENTKIQSRIEGVVGRTCAAGAVSNGDAFVNEFPICSCYLYDMRVTERDEQRIIPMNIVGDDCEQMLDRYYVNSQLFPESKLPAGHLLRDWSKIPGRSPSPENRKRESVGRTDALELEIEKELEAINKQSEVFLQNFDWRENTASPDLFGDLSAVSASDTSMVVDDDKVEEGLIIIERAEEEEDIPKESPIEEQGDETVEKGSEQGTI